jgi:serine/threonine protein kinase
VKVSDFGIAHLVESQSDALKTLRANKTLQAADEQHIGSPYWMAPEVTIFLFCFISSFFSSTGCDDAGRDSGVGHLVHRVHGD